MTALVKVAYRDISVSFTEDAWFNATAVAERFGKRIQDWLDNQETKDYIDALADFHNHAKKRDLDPRKISEAQPLIRTKRGKSGGTWLHPDLAVPFARWLDVRFGVWCDQQIKQLLTGTHQHYDWKRLRSEAASSFKVMNAVLQLQRQTQGKATAAHHFQNEAKLVNWALSGKYQGIDRAALSGGDLETLAKLEERNAVLIGVGLDREVRKKALEKFVSDWRNAIAPALEAA